MLMHSNLMAHFKLSSLVTFLSAALSAVGQGNKVCNATAGICLQQYSVPEANLTLGLGIPASSLAQADPFANDFFVNMTAPLPYGFAGFFANTTGKFAHSGIGDVMTFVGNDTDLVPINGLGQLIQNDQVILSQISTLAPDGSAYIPTTNHIVTLTLSNLSFFTADHANWIFRCQNCTLIDDVKEGSKSPSALLITLFWSTVPVQYTSDKIHSARYPLTDDLIVGHVNVTLKDIVVDNYQGLLKAAGL